jgi:hypothetical protein
MKGTAGLTGAPGVGGWEWAGVADVAGLATVGVTRGTTSVGRAGVASGGGVSGDV